MTTTCERIGSWAASLTEADVPEGVRERCELQRASIMAAARAGEREAAPFADVAGKGPLGEVFASAAASIAHDWDDYLYMGHTGHSAVAVSRALRELHMTDLSLGMRDLGVLAREPRLLGQLRRAALSPGEGGTSTLDTRSLRMTFPCRLTLRLRSGRVIELDGSEPGACGHPLAEQREVVERKMALIGIASGAAARG